MQAAKDHETVVVAPRTELGSNNDSGDDDCTMGVTDGDSTMGDTDGTITAITAVTNTATNDTNTMPLKTLFADYHINLSACIHDSSACTRDVCTCADCSAT